ncbi:hypothetical protein NEOC84_001901|nr:hypothetical protein [Neochlamydia sp. AcF84]
MDQGRVPSTRLDKSIFTTLGITSPPFSIIARSPTRMSLRLTSSWLCNVARAIVLPARKTGSNSATGVKTPVRPTCTVIAWIRVATCSAANL